MKSSSLELSLELLLFFASSVSMCLIFGLRFSFFVPSSPCVFLGLRFESLFRGLKLRCRSCELSACFLLFSSGSRGGPDLQTMAKWFYLPHFRHFAPYAGQFAFPC